MREVKILLNYLLYILVGFVICLVGISNVFADTYDAYEFTAQLYDNTNGSLSNVTTSFSNNYWVGTIPTMVANSSGAAWGISTPIPLISNHTYTLSVFLSHECGNTILSTYNRIGVGNSLNNAKTSYQNNSNVVENVSQVYNSPLGQGLQFAFTPSVNGNYIVFPFSTSLGCSNARFTFTDYDLNDLGSSGGVSINDINSSLTSQTNNINSNSDNNRDLIINNQNENTDKEIESQKVCTTTTIDKDDIKTEGKYLNNNGGENNNVNFGITDYIELSNSSVITLTKSRAGSSVSYCFYDSSKTKISCDILGTNPQVGDTYTIPDNTKYVRFSINKTDNNPQYEISGACINGNQAINDSLKENEKTSKGILGKIGDLFNTLFSTDDADISGLDNMVGWLPPGPLDSIINLPLALFNALANTLTGTCQSVSLTLPFVNKVLTLPCFNSFMSQYINGFSTLWTFIGGIVTIFILYNYLLSLYKWVDDTLTLRENNLPGYYDDNWGGGA